MEELKQTKGLSDEWKAEYVAMKEKHADCVLLMSSGEYYVCYGEDAKDVAPIIGKILLRESGAPITEGYVLFLKSELDTMLPKLIRAGKRVRIYEYIKK